MAAVMEKLPDSLRLFLVRLQSDERLFWLSVASLAALAVILLLLLLHGSVRKRKRREQDADGQTTFVPVDADKETAEIFLPLADKLILEATQLDAVSPELTQKIREQKPGSLSDLLLAINKVTGPYREDLRRIISAEQMLLVYARNLGRAGYQPYTLASAWHECPDPAVLPTFVELLASREEEVQMAAVRLLIAINEPKSLTYLASALLQPYRYVPARVAEVLIAMGESAAWLLCYLLAEIESEYKPAVLAVLGQMRPGYPLEQVIACLHDENELTRRAAAAALGDGRALAALNELTVAAQDPDWSVRAAVAKSLGQIGDPSSQATLESLAADEVWVVSINARESLRRMYMRQNAG